MRHDGPQWERKVTLGEARNPVQKKFSATNGEGPAVFPPSPLNQPACKPGSVRRGARPRTRDGHSSGTPVTRRLQQPTRTTRPGHRSRASRLREEARAVPIRSCSRWGLPCRFRRRKRGALLPHRFTLTRLTLAGIGGRSAFCGTFPETGPALARGSTRRTLSGTACPWSPDFPLRATFRHCPKRPSGRLTARCGGRGASAAVR